MNANSYLLFLDGFDFDFFHITILIFKNYDQKIGKVATPPYKRSIEILITL